MARTAKQKERASLAAFRRFEEAYVAVERQVWEAGDGRTPLDGETMATMREAHVMMRRWTIEKAPVEGEEIRRKASQSED